MMEAIFISVSSQVMRFTFQGCPSWWIGRLNMHQETHVQAWFVVVFILLFYWWLASIKVAKRLRGRSRSVLKEGSKHQSHHKSNNHLNHMEVWRGGSRSVQIQQKSWNGTHAGKVAPKMRQKTLNTTFKRRRCFPQNDVKGKNITEGYRLYCVMWPEHFWSREIRFSLFIRASGAKVQASLSALH